LKQKIWSPVNITLAYPIREYTYVLVGGYNTLNRYMDPVAEALVSYGVGRNQIIRAPINYKASTLESAKVLFNLLNTTYWNVFKEQKIIFVTHSNGVIPVHALYALFPDARAMIHGLISLNPTWGGSVIASNYGGLPKDVLAAAKGFGLKGRTVNDISYNARREFVRAYPVDYNEMRVLVLATHAAKPSARYVATSKYVSLYSKEINDGVLSLSDQIVPGGRVVLVSDCDHEQLVYPSASLINNPLLSAQSYIYTFFKVTP